MILHMETMIQRLAACEAYSLMELNSHLSWAREDIVEEHLTVHTSCTHAPHHTRKCGRPCYHGRDELTH